ncbi:MAG: response regulator [Alphaproteobacteria bacterium]|nr:response regulator [Alphaproteobacteria bacterium]
MNRVHHVLVIDDDRRLRELLRKYLSDNGYAVTTAASAAEARARLQGLAFDLLIVDVMMPGEDGLTFTEAMRQTSDVPILVLTAMGEPEDRIAGLERGADDYLAKPFEPRELLLRLASLLRRVAPVPAAAEILFGPYLFDLARVELRRGAEVVHLTAGEAALLKALATRRGEVLSRDALARACGLQGNERTIDVQITRLRRKIEADARTPVHIKTVWGEGYVLHAG